MRHYKTLILQLYFIFMALLGHDACAVNKAFKEVKFLDFTGTENYLQLNGEAKIQVDTFSGSQEEKMIIRLVPRKSNSDGTVAGSAFLKFPLIPGALGEYAFSSFFRFRITANNIYDGSGIVFMIQSDQRGSKALGKKIDGMGFAGDVMQDGPSITPSLGVKFDVQHDENNTIDIDFNSVATVINGTLDSLYPPYGYPVAENQLNNGIPWNVWIDYDGQYLAIKTTQSAEKSLSTEHTKRPILLRSILRRSLNEKKATPDVYIGFSADPGFFPAFHDILEWHFRPYYKPYGDYCGDDSDSRPASCLALEKRVQDKKRSKGDKS